MQRVDIDIMWNISDQDLRDLAGEQGVTYSNDKNNTKYNILVELANKGRLNRGESFYVRHSDFPALMERNYTPDEIRKQLIPQLQVCPKNEVDDDGNLIDPVTYDTLSDDYVTIDGRCYDRETLKRWFSEGQTNDPVTMVPVPQEIIDRVLDNKLINLIISKDHESLASYLRHNQENLIEHPEYFETAVAYGMENTFSEYFHGVRAGDEILNSEAWRKIWNGGTYILHRLVSLLKICHPRVVYSIVEENDELQQFDLLFERYMEYVRRSRDYHTLIEQIITISYEDDDNDVIFDCFNLTDSEYLKFKPPYLPSKGKRLLGLNDELGAEYLIADQHFSEVLQNIFLEKYETWSNGESVDTMMKISSLNDTDLSDRLMVPAFERFCTDPSFVKDFTENYSKPYDEVIQLVLHKRLPELALKMMGIIKQDTQEMKEKLTSIVLKSVVEFDESVYDYLSPIFLSIEVEELIQMLIVDVHIPYIVGVVDSLNLENLVLDDFEMPDDTCRYNAKLLEYLLPHDDEPETVMMMNEFFIRNYDQNKLELLSHHRKFGFVNINETDHPWVHKIFEYNHPDYLSLARLFGVTPHFLIDQIKQHVRNPNFSNSSEQNIGKTDHAKNIDKNVATAIIFTSPEEDEDTIKFCIDYLVPKFSGSVLSHFRYSYAMKQYLETVVKQTNRIKYNLLTTLIN